MRRIISMIDQASKLRQMIIEKKELYKEAKQGVKIYSVVSGKGGVGKTNFTINLAIKLQQMGKKVLILDADIGFSNANILLGVETHYNLFHLINETASLEEITVKCAQGVDLISGGTDLFILGELDDEKQEGIINSLSLLGEYDVLLIDNGAGISKHTITFTTFAHDVILVTTPEPTAITDAYSFLKGISIYNAKEKVKIVVNQVADTSFGDEAFEKLSNTAKQFLQLELENIGYIYNDSRVSKSIMDQIPVVIKYPNALASRNIEQISKNILGDKNFDFNVSNFRQLGNRIIKMFG